MLYFIYERFSGKHAKSGSLLLLLLLTLAGCRYLNTFPAEYWKYKNPEQLKQLIESSDQNFVIVDVRPVSAYDRGHIPTAINIVNGDVSKIEDPPAKDKYLILYCETGGRAEVAGRRMEEKGYKYILNWGGYTRWPYEFEKTPETVNEPESSEEAAPEEN